MSPSPRASCRAGSVTSFDDPAINYLTSQPWIYELVHRPGPPWAVEAAGTRPNRRCAIAWLSVRTLRFQMPIKAEPILLLHRG
jgi:hypothetical protein